MQPSSLIANIALCAATLIFVVMVYELHLKPAPRGGDAAVGYAWAIIFFNLAFFACVAIATVAIAWRGGFQWVSANGSMRFALVAFGMLAVCFAAGLGSFGPGEAPKFLKPVALPLTLALPLAVIITGFLLANDPLPGGVPSETARWLTKLMFWPGAAITGVFAGALLFQKARNISAAVTYDRNRLDSFEQGILTQIDTCDIGKDMVFLLVHTDANRKPAIRERALAKIKTRPDWQEELVRRLDSGWAAEPFTFLASNEVEDKTLFPEPIRKGILHQAEIIRKSIQESRHFYADHYIWEVRRLLRAVEKFEGMGVDYLPAVRELRAAFVVHSKPEDPKYDCIQILDKWMEKRQ